MANLFRCGSNQNSNLNNKLKVVLNETPYITTNTILTLPDKWKVCFIHDGHATQTDYHQTFVLNGEDSVITYNTLMTVEYLSDNTIKVTNAATPGTGRFIVYN